MNSNTSEDGILSIHKEKIFREWQAGKSPVQIAHEMNLEITLVTRVLKEQQKSIVHRGR